MVQNLDGYCPFELKAGLGAHAAGRAGRAGRRRGAGMARRARQKAGALSSA